MTQPVRLTSTVAVHEATGGHVRTITMAFPKPQTLEPLLPKAFDASRVESCKSDALILRSKKEPKKGVHRMKPSSGRELGPAYRELLYESRAKRACLKISICRVLEFY